MPRSPLLPFGEDRPGIFSRIGSILSDRIGSFASDRIIRAHDEQVAARFTDMSATENLPQPSVSESSSPHRRSILRRSWVDGLSGQADVFLSQLTHNIQSRNSDVYIEQIHMLEPTRIQVTGRRYSRIGGTSTLGDASCIQEIVQEALTDLVPQNLGLTPRVIINTITETRQSGWPSPGICVELLLDYIRREEPRTVDIEATVSANTPSSELSAPRQFHLVVPSEITNHISTSFLASFHSHAISTTAASGMIEIGAVHERGLDLLISADNEHDCRRLRRDFLDKFHTTEWLNRRMQLSSPEDDHIIRLQFTSVNYRIGMLNAYQTERYRQRTEVFTAQVTGRTATNVAEEQFIEQAPTFPPNSIAEHIAAELSEDESLLLVIALNKVIRETGSRVTYLGAPMGEKLKAVLDKLIPGGSTMV